MIEARGPENLPPAPPKQCERKGMMWGLQSHRAVLKRAMPKGVALFLVHIRLMKELFMKGKIAEI